jgi:hypothetical protein
MDALRLDDADGLSRHDAPENKKPSWPKRELGGSRFSCIFKRPQSEYKSALPDDFGRRKITSPPANVNSWHSPGSGVVMAYPVAYFWYHCHSGIDEDWGEA